MNQQAPIVVIGTGLAGYHLVKELRKLSPEQAIVMITADDGRSYSKPMLSTGFSKNKSADELAMASAADMAEQLNIVVRTNTEVTNIVPLEHKLYIGTEEVSYSKLVLALGANVLTPPIEGDAQDRIFSINDLQDYAKFRTVADTQKRVLIMGAGLIGCEYANDMCAGGYEVDVVDPSGHALPRSEEHTSELQSRPHLVCRLLLRLHPRSTLFPYTTLFRSGDAQDRIFSINDLQDYAKFRTVGDTQKRVLIMGAGIIGCEYANDMCAGGYEVDVVDPSGHALPSLLPEPAGKALQDGLEELGVRFHLGAVVNTLTRQDSGVKAELSNGTTIEADLVVSAIGLRPRVDLATLSGLKTGVGIKVNKLLETSASDIYRSEEEHTSELQSR